MKRKTNVEVGKIMTDKMVADASSQGGISGVTAKRKRRIMVAVEEALNVPDPDEGPNKRTTFEHSGYVPITDVRSKDFDKRLSKVEVALSAFQSDHEALSAKFIFEVNEIKKMLETLSKKELLDDNEAE
ncbi:unnamed protein product, partial [Ilex paraguariensis]